MNRRNTAHSVALPPIRDSLSTRGMANYTKRDERHASIADFNAKRRSPAPRAKAKPGPPPTLIQEMRKGYTWCWFICPLCDHRSPMALAPFAIRYGMDVPTIDVAKFLRCSRCGHVGALLQRVSMHGIAGALELEPFPADRISDGVAQWIARRRKSTLPAHYLAFSAASTLSKHSSRRLAHSSSVTQPAFPAGMIFENV